MLIACCQNLSSLFLKALVDGASMTCWGSRFQSVTTLRLKNVRRMRLVVLDRDSFRLWPLMLCPVSLNWKNWLGSMFSLWLEGMKRAELEQYVDTEAKWQTGFLTQYRTLVRRNFLREKGRYLSKIYLGSLLFRALVFGLIWFRTPRDEITAGDRFGLVSIRLCVIRHGRNTLVLWNSRSRCYIALGLKMLFPETWTKIGSVGRIFF